MDMQALKCEMSRTMGVLGMAYAMIRDQILDMDDNQEKVFKIDDVMSDTINGLNQALEGLPDSTEEPDTFMKECASDYQGFVSYFTQCDVCAESHIDNLRVKFDLKTGYKYICRDCLDTAIKNYQQKIWFDNREDSNERSTAD